MANKLKFFWRMGDFALEACDKNLLQRSDNVTIELVKYYRSKGKEFKYSLGYFEYNDREPHWELKFFGDCFKEVMEADLAKLFEMLALAKLFEMLACAYDALEKWYTGEEVDDE